MTSKYWQVFIPDNEGDTTVSSWILQEQCTRQHTEIGPKPIANEDV